MAGKETDMSEDDKKKKEHDLISSKPEIDKKSNDHAKRYKVIDTWNENESVKPGPVKNGSLPTDSSRIASFVGGFAGVMASTAVGYLFKEHMPVFDSKLKNAVTGIGLYFVGSSVGTIVSKCVAEEVEDTIDVIEEFRREVAARKAGA